MITITGYKNEVLSLFENKVTEQLKNAVRTNNNQELFFLSDLYAALGIAIIRNNSNREDEP